MTSENEKSVSSSESARQRYRHFSLDEKSKAVMRVLKGEQAYSVAQEIGVSENRLERWHAQFVSGGRDALQPKRDQGNRLYRKLNENLQQIWQWVLLLVALVLVVMAGLRFLNRASP